MLTIKPYIELREVSDWLRLEKKLIRETARSDLCIASNELHSWYGEEILNAYHHYDWRIKMQKEKKLSNEWFT